MTEGTPVIRQLAKAVVDKQGGLNSAQRHYLQIDLEAALLHAQQVQRDELAQIVENVMPQFERDDFENSHWLPKSVRLVDLDVVLATLRSQEIP